MHPAKIKPLSPRLPARKKSNPRIWRIVEGAVRDAVNAHPDMLTEKGRNSFVQSVTKRVVGNIGSADFGGLSRDAAERPARGKPDRNHNG